MSNFDTYQAVTDRILEVMAHGKIPWVKPWGGSNLMPRNIRGTRYHGANLFLLAMLPYDDPTFLTFKQAKALGGSVRKGEHGTKVIYWQVIEKQNEEGKVEKIPMLKAFTVFHVSQCEGLDYSPRATVTRNREEAIQEAEAVWTGYQGAPSLSFGGDRACYSPAFDMIQVPKPESFDSRPHYYSTLFHEAVHSTGHTSRLNRPEVAGRIDFGSESYSREELVAELGAAMLAAHAGTGNDDTIRNSAAYIQGWSKYLQGDPKAFIYAAARASKAVAHILGATETEDGGE